MRPRRPIPRVASRTLNGSAVDDAGGRAHHRTSDRQGPDTRTSVFIGTSRLDVTVLRSLDADSYAARRDEVVAAMLSRHGGAPLPLYGDSVAGAVGGVYAHAGVPGGCVTACTKQPAPGTI